MVVARLIHSSLSSFSWCHSSSCSHERQWSPQGTKVLLRCVLVSRSQLTTQTTETPIRRHAEPSCELRFLLLVAATYYFFADATLRQNILWAESTWLVLCCSASFFGMFRRCSSSQQLFTCCYISPRLTVHRKTNASQRQVVGRWSDDGLRRYIKIC